jgi:hypothetical protein
LAPKHEKNKTELVGILAFFTHVYQELNLQLPIVRIGIWVLKIEQRAQRSIN